MKKIITIFMCLTVVLSLVACGGINDPGAAEENENALQRAYEFGESL